MQARILNPAEEHLWEKFVRNHSLGNIHQTPEWGHFQAKVAGRGKYWIIVIEESGPNSQMSPKILAGTLLIRHRLPKGYCWLYAPRGPLLTYDHKNNYSTAKTQMNVLLSEIRKIAKQEKAIFLRVDPLIKSAPALAFPHFRQNISGFQPDHTLILDLTKSEQELLAQMKPKGRYNIKLAEKKGVKIRRADPSNPKQFSEDLTAFYRILTETTSRDGFHGHDLQFYKDMLESLNTNATLYLAEFDNQIIAACLNTFYKDTATYYFGASGSAHRNVMAPYLLHWQAIRDAKQKGYKFYDFFGIAEAGAKHHPWAGVTEFKKKFGGTEVSYKKPQEFPFIKSLYLLYRTYKKLKN